MFNGFIEIVLGLVGLSIVVVVHEAGHFLAARCLKIRVETFSVGFGKKLLGFTRNGTEYRLSLLPLGGYCRFSGENAFRDAIENNKSAIETEEGDFYAAAAWKRIIVAVAGPLANVIFAVLVFFLITWIGYNEKYAEPRIILASEWDESDELWPADEAGLQSGDLIVEVDGTPVRRFSELRQLLAFRPEEDVALTLNRSGETVQTILRPRLDAESGRALIGVLRWLDPVVGPLTEDSPAAESGLREGDTILAVNDTPVRHTTGLVTLLRAAGETEVSLTYSRNGNTARAAPVPGAGLLSSLNFTFLEGRSPKLTLPEALKQGFSETWGILSSTIKGFRMLFLGVNLQNAVSGPLRLISDTGSVVAEGFRTGLGPGLLWSSQLMALISVSLAFLNLLPIPVLDGGQILLFITEMIKRRPISPKSVYRYQFVGTIIVFAIALLATAGDLLHFNGR